MNATEFNEIVENLMKKHALKKVDIANLIGTTTTTMQLWKNNKRNISTPFQKLLRSMLLHSEVIRVLHDHIEIKTITISRMEEVRSNILVEDKVIKKKELANRIGVKVGAMNQWYAGLKAISPPYVKLLILIDNIPSFIESLQKY